MDWRELNEDYDKLMAKIRKENGVDPSVEKFEFKLNDEDSSELMKLESLKRLGPIKDAVKTPSKTAQWVYLLLMLFSFPGYFLYGLYMFGKFTDSPSWVSYMLAAFPIFIIVHLIADKTSNIINEHEQYIVKLEQKIHNEHELYIVKLEHKIQHLEEKLAEMEAKHE